MRKASTNEDKIEKEKEKENKKNKEKYGKEIWHTKVPWVVTRNSLGILNGGGSAHCGLRTSL